MFTIKKKKISKMADQASYEISGSSAWDVSNQKSDPNPRGRPLRKRKIYWVAASAIILLFVFLFWMYSGSLTEFKIKIFQTIPLPISLVNGRLLPMKDYLVRLSVAQKVLNAQESENAKPLVIKQLIKEAEISQIASQKGLYVSQKQTDEMFLAVSENTNLHNAPNFKEYLLDQGLSENIFKESILKPELLRSQLQLWFNSQPDLSPKTYKFANALVEEIQNGRDMAELASQFTEDGTGKSSGGDMGYLQIIDLSPELREKVGNLKQGEVKIIPGLMGIYVMRMEGQVGNKVHLREIFLRGSSFGDWLDNQEKNFKVINLLNT